MTLESVLAAVRRHRLNIWGNGPVEHDEDVALYKACGIEAGSDD